MDKRAIFTLLRSIFITLLVSAIASYFLTYTGLHFLPTFIFTTLLQFLFFYFYGIYLTNKRYKDTLEAETTIAKEFSKQTARVTCPCDRRVQTDVPINVNEENSYICPGCDKQITIFVETKTALATKPVYTNPLDTPLILPEVEKMLNEQRK